MSMQLALVVRVDKHAYSIHRKQLQVTQDLIRSLYSNTHTKIEEHASGAEGTVTTHANTKPFRLMDLPFELRIMILEHHAGSNTIRPYLRRSWRRPCLPRAAFAGNKQLMEEAQYVALKQYTVEIHSGPGNEMFREWLSRIIFTKVESSIKIGFDAIHHLRFPYFSWFPYERSDITTNHDVQLVVAYPNLRTLTLEFHLEEVYRISRKIRQLRGDPFYYDSSKDYHQEDTFKNSIEAMRTNYQLDGIIGATKLEKLFIDVGKVYVSPDGHACDTIRALISWFDEQFRMRNQKVAVKLAYYAVSDGDDDY